MCGIMKRPRYVALFCKKIGPIEIIVRGEFPFSSVESDCMHLEPEKAKGNDEGLVLNLGSDFAARSGESEIRSLQSRWPFQRLAARQEWDPHVQLAGCSFSRST